MSSMKIGSSVRPQPPSASSATERAAPRVESQPTPVVASVDEFVSSGPVRGSGTTPDAFALPSAVAPSVPVPSAPVQAELWLSDSLEPFRAGLDALRGQITPELQSRPNELRDFVFGGLEKLGIPNNDMGEAYRYVAGGGWAQSLGRDRVVA